MPDNPNPSKNDPTPPPWFDKYGVPAEDHGILGKYKDEAEAIRSIGARERYISQTVKLPDAKADAKERGKQTREILGRLGAYESPEKYQEAIAGLIPDELKDDIDPEKLQAACKKAFERGLLPEVFIEGFKENVATLLEERKQAKDAEDERLRLEKANDVHLDEVFGTARTVKLADAEAFANHLDKTLFSEDNRPAGRARLSGEQIAEGKGILFRELKRVNSPWLWRAFADMQRRVFGEGPHHEHNTPPGGGKGAAWQQYHDKFMRDCGTLGEEEARRYADDMTGGHGP
jgi:hypothetical protein